MSIVSGILAADASEDAADAQVESTEAAIETELEMYYQTREDLSPWIEAGEAALADVQKIISEGPGEYEESDQYNFLVDETMKALAKSSSAKGQLDSGVSSKEAMQYAQGLASTDYQNWINNWLSTKVNPLLSLSGSGQVATSEQASATSATSSSITDSTLSAGDARASGYINTANAYTGAIDSAVEGYMFYNYLSS